MTSHTDARPQAAEAPSNASVDRYDAFISYSREDSGFVAGEAGLLEALARRGLSVWLDVESIPGGANFKTRIRRGIESANGFVFVISPEALTSAECRRELQHAIDLDKLIIPIYHRDVPRRELPPELANPQWIFLRSTDDCGAGIDRLVDALATDLQWRDQLTALTAKVREWQAADEARSFLLHGAQLRAAEQYLVEQAKHRQKVTADQSRYIELSRHAAQRLRLVGFAAIVCTLIVVAALAAVAFVQRNVARHQAARATSLALAATANSDLNQPLDASLTLALAANEVSPNEAARSSMMSALESTRGRGVEGIVHGHTNAVTGVAFSPNGRTLASASEDGTVRLWDVTTRRQLGTALTAGTGAVGRGLAFSPDGRTLALATDDGVRLWDLRTHRQLRPLGPADLVNSVAFSPDGRILAAGLYRDTGGVKLWDLASHRLRGWVGGGTVNSVAFSLDGRTLASGGCVDACATGSADGVVALWTVATLKLLGRPLTEHIGGVNSVAFSPDGRTLVSGGDDGGRLWDTATDRQLGRPLTRRTGGIDGVAFSPDGRTVAAGGDDQTVRLLDVATHSQLGTPLTGHHGDVNSVAFSPDGRTLASGSSDKTVILWDLANREQLNTPLVGPPMAGPRDQVNSVAVSPDGRTLAAGSDGITLWDLETRRRVGTFHSFDIVASVAFSPNGHVLAWAGDSGFTVWNVMTRRQIAVLDTSDSVGGIAFSPDGRTLAAGGLSDITLWNLATHRQVGRLTGDDDQVNAVAFSPDGRTLASGSDDGTVRLWDVATHRQLVRLSPGVASSSVAFSPDGRTLASGNDGGTVTLWDVDSHRRLDTLMIAPNNYVRGVGVAFSPDGRTLASGSADNTLRLWDVATLQPLGTPLSGATGAVTSVAFTPDGLALATGSSDGTVRLWSGVLWRSLADLRDTVCSVVGAGLSPSEWAQYAPGIHYQQVCP